MSRAKRDETLPGRARLSAEDLAACFAAASLTPPPGSLFEGLPNSPGPPRAALLAGEGQIKPELAAMVGVLAAPAFALAIDLYRPAASDAVRLAVAGNAEGRFVLVGREGEAFDLALLTEVGQFLALIDDLTGLSLAPATAGDFTARLPLEGLAALAGVADLLRHQTLRSVLSRDAGVQSGVVVWPIEEPDLAAVFADGIDKPDLRWAVSLAACLSDGELARCRADGALQRGAAALIEAGLLDEDAILTVEGLGLAQALSETVAAARFLLTSDDSGNLALGRLVFWQTPQGLLAGAWSAASAAPEVTLREVSPGQALQAIAALIEPHQADAKKQAKKAKTQRKKAPMAKRKKAAAPESAACPACSETLRAGARFCTHCGAAV